VERAAGSPTGSRAFPVHTYVAAHPHDPPHMACAAHAQKICHARSISRLEPRPDHQCHQPLSSRHFVKSRFGLGPCHSMARSGVSTQLVPKRSGGLWTAGSGSVRTSRAARWSRAREPAPAHTSTRLQDGWMMSACEGRKKLRDEQGVHTPDHRPLPLKPMVSAGLRRAVTSLELS
jgi:hypothetical protein